MTIFVNAWRDDENQCMNFVIPLLAEVDQMEEFVRGLTNLKDPTMRSFGDAQSKAMRAHAESGQYHTIGVEICDS